MVCTDNNKVNHKTENQIVLMKTIFSNCTVIVQLENINDWSPEFLNGPYSFSVPENALPNTASIGDIAVRDRDGDHVTVMIQGHNSGNITVKFLKFWTPTQFTVSALNLKLKGSTMVPCLQMMQIE